MKKLFNLIQVTAEEVKQSENREYNPRVWEDRVTNMSIYRDVSFYKREDGAFYVVYTIDEGIRMIKKLTYSETMTNSLFVGYVILPLIEDGKEVEGKVTLYRETPEGKGFAEHPDLRKKLAEASAQDANICFARFLSI